MATRFYLPSSGAQDVSVAVAAVWLETNHAILCKCNTSKTSTTMLPTSYSGVTTTNLANPNYNLIAQYVSIPFGAYEWTASGTVRVQMQVAEDSANYNDYLWLNVRVVSGDGLTVRGTLFSAVGATEFDYNAYHNRTVNGNCSAVSQQNGDRIVIEIGFQKNSSSSGKYYYYAGDNNANDLPADETSTSIYNPWCEFSPTIPAYSSTSAPTVTTTTPDTITPTTAASGGNVTADGGATVTARGVCWSTSANPTTADSKTTDGSGTGSFSSSITGLSPATVYHVRAYATNSVGTSYGADDQFTSGAAVAQVLAEVNHGVESTLKGRGFVKLIHEIIHRYLPGIVKVIGETEHGAEGTVRSRGLKKVISELGEVVEGSFTKSMVYTQLIAEIASNPESLAQARGLTRLAAETVRAVEVIVKVMGHGLVKVIAEIAHLPETLAKTIAGEVVKVISEAAHAVEGRIKIVSHNLVKIIAEIGHGVEAILGPHGIVQVISEALRSVESAVRIRDLVKVLMGRVYLREQSTAARALVQVVREVTFLIHRALKKISVIPKSILGAVGIIPKSRVRSVNPTGGIAKIVPKSKIKGGK